MANLQTNLFEGDVYIKTSLDPGVYGSGNLNIEGTLTVSNFSIASGDLDLGGNLIHNVGTPVVGTDAPNKNYVDDSIKNLSPKTSVVVATTTTGTLSSSFANGSVIDGITLLTNQRILIKDQSNPIENGIYIVNASGAPTRASDLTTGSGASGIYVFSESGTLNIGSGFVCISPNGTDIIGTHSITFSQFTGAGQIIAGTGLSKSVNTLSVNALQTQITQVGTLTSLSIASQFNLNGATSGIISIKSQANSGTYNLNLPITAGSSGQVLTSAGGGANVMTWSTPGTGTVSSVAATVPSFLSISGSPITSSGTLAITLSGTALPIANGGTGSTTATGSGSVVLANTPTLITPNIGSATGTSLSVTGQLTSTVSTGTAPLVVSSTTNVINLNASSINGNTFASPGVIGSGAPNTINTTQLNVNGSSSGVISITPQAVAGTFNFNLPTTPGTIGQSLVSGGGASTPMYWINPITSISLTTPAFLNVSGSPLTSNGTLAISFSGTALPVANGGTGVTTSTGSGSVVLSNTPTLVAPVIGAATGTSLSVTGQLTSTVSTGTAPLSVSSTTNVANLNASSINGNTFASPGIIGGTSASAVNTTQLNVNGGTSGVISIIPQAAAGTFNFNLPTTAGSSGQVLTSTGGGSNAMTWSSVGVGSVTSVAATVPAFLSISGSPITSSGTLAITLSGTALPVANGGTGATTSTGSGSVVLANTPTLITPVIGAATGSSLSVTGQLTSTVSTGTAPLVVSSTTNVPNLNASSINGATFASPGVIGSGAPNIINTTQLNLNGSSSGVISIIPQAAAGTFNFNLPITAGTSGQVLTSAGGSAAPMTWATPTIGTVTSVAATVPTFLSISGSPITSSGTLAITLSGTALPVANGGTGSTTSTGSGSVVLANTPTLITPVIGTATGTSLSVTGQLTSTVSTGTAPLVVSSTTNVSNLNASSINGNTFSAPGVIGSGAPNVVNSTQLNVNGSSSGVISIIPQAAAGTFNFNLPTTAGSSGQVLTSAGGGANAMTWSSVGVGSVTSVSATVPAFLSISGSPITSSGTLAITLSGTALPVANGGTGSTTSTGSGSVVLANTPTLITPNIGAATGTSLSVTGQLTSTVSTGTAPLVVSSTTNVSNLNASSINGNTFSIPGPIGGGTASSGTFTTGSFSSTLNMNSNKITNLGTPTNTTDAATKAYVDSASQGLSSKASVLAATTIAGTLATSFENGDIIDGVTLVTGDRILIKDQSNGIENGIYTVNSSGSPSRATDLTAGSDAGGVYTFVQGGTVNTGSGFVCISVNPNDIVGTNSLVFTQFSGAGQITAGTGLTKTGNTLSVNASQTQITTVGTLTSTSIASQLDLLGSTSGNISIKTQANSGTFNFNLPTTSGSSGQVLTSAGGGANAMTWENVGIGSVTSVAATVPAFLSISGSPITSSGTLAITLSGTALPVANGGTGSTTSTGSGAVVLANTPTLITPVIGAATGTSLNVTGQLTSTVSTGTPPLVVSSTTNVPNLNASSINGNTFSIPGVIGGTTANVVNSTQLNVNGSSSGVISIIPQAAAGTFNFNLPITAGTSGQVLTSAGGGASAMTWTNAGVGSVTSVAATVPAFLSISGSPITSSGTLAITLSGTALPVLNGGTGSTTSTGSGAVVLANTPTLITPVIGVATGTSLSVTGQLTSTVSTGTAPIVVSSTTNVSNLNASSINGNTFAIPGVIGGTTANTINTTQLNVNGSSSGVISIIPQAAAGTFNFNLPITAGTAGQVLTSAGGGASAMTWTNAGVGTVTSVAATVPAFLSISGSPVTSSGTLAITLSGTALPVANGGTGTTTSTGSGSVVLANTPTLITPVIGVATGTSLSVTGQLTSTVSTGTAPLVVSSTTNVPNLNASSINGNTFAIPGVIGGTTANVVNTTRLNVNGSTSGVVSIIPQAVAGTFNFNLPTTAGSSGQVLTSAGGGASAMTWTNAGVGTVTSVAATVPAFLSISGSPVTSSGTLAITLSGTALPVLNGGTGTTTSTGSGAVVLANTPTLITPVIGVATGTSLSVTGQLTSTVSTGTAPIVVASTTNVANLNASSLNGATFASPGPIGSGTASTGAFTTLSASNTTDPTSVSTGSIITSGGIGISKGVYLGSSFSYNYASTKGVLFTIPNGLTVNDSSTTASSTNTVFNTVFLGGQTVSATNTAITTTNASTVYIDSPPTAGTNMTITNPWSLYINSGNARFTNGLIITPFLGGTWIDLPTTGPSGVGTGGAGVNPFIAYVASGGQWFTDAVTGDIVYRNTTGKILWGISSGTSNMEMSATGDLSINTTTESTTLATGALKVSGGAAVTKNMSIGGDINMIGSTSGTVSVQTQAVAGTYNFNLPTTAGTAGQVLTSQAGGATAMTWSTLPGQICWFLSDQKASGTNGGTFTNGAFRIRTLNTITSNIADSSVTLSGDVITMTAGTYLIEGRSPAYQVQANIARLWDITSSVSALGGTSAHGGTGAGGSMTFSFINGYITIASTTTYRLEHRCATTVTNTGFGIASGFAGEIYARLNITKLA